jgi:predicted double-glycine peptidase
MQIERGVRTRANASGRWPRVVIPASIAILVCAAAVLLYLHNAEPRLQHLPMVRQSTPYTCGAAALQSILYYYGQEFREDNLARELKTNPDQGTDYHEIIRFAQSKGLTAEAAEGMTVEDLRRAVGAGRPVMVAFQAWGDKPETYAEDWEDGHYSIIIGVDSKCVYLMDPSTLGNYTFIPIPEFVGRWHDAYTNRDGRKIQLVHFGITFDSKAKPVFDPKAIMPLK